MQKNRNRASLENSGTTENIADGSDPGVGGTQKLVLVKETKAEKFIRLANRRVNKLIRLMGHVSNLGNRNVYEYTSTQQAKLIAAIERSFDHMKDSFAGTKKLVTGFSINGD